MAIGRDRLRGSVAKTFCQVGLKYSRLIFGSRRFDSVEGSPLSSPVSG